MGFQKGQSGNPKGRPRKADSHAGAIAAAERKIADRLPSLIENMLTLADGYWTEEITKEGKRVVYKTAPDFKANQYLIDRIMGKPTERTEVSGPDGGDIALQVFTKALDTAYAGDDDTTH